MTVHPYGQRYIEASAHDAHGGEGGGIGGTSSLGLPHPSRAVSTLLRVLDAVPFVEERLRLKLAGVRDDPACRRLVVLHRGGRANQGAVEALIQAAIDATPSLEGTRFIVHDASAT